MRIKQPIKVAMLFALSGAVLSAVFAALVHRSAPSEFWFIIGTKYLIPKLTYWVGFGVLLAIAVLVSYCASVLLRWTINIGLPAMRRQILAMLIFIGAFPLGYIVGVALIGVLDPVLGYLVAYIVIVVIISSSLWLFTTKWNISLLLFLFLALPISYFVTITVYNLLNLSNYGYDILKMGSLGFLLCGICGYWYATSTSRCLAS